MTKRRLFIAVSVIVWLVVLAIGVKVTLDSVSVPPWGNLAGDAETIELAGDRRVGQQFTAPWPGLYRIEVGLDRGSASDSEEITFHLKNSPTDSQDLWTATLEADEIEGETVYSFEFPPFHDSKGQSFYFYLESAESAPGNAIAVHHSRGVLLPGANAYVDDQPVSGNLQFHTFYSLRTRDKVDALLTKMAAGRPYFFGSKGFYVGLAVLYALVLGLFLWQITAIIVREEEQ